jgi:hypothetical protein
MHADMKMLMAFFMTYTNLLTKLLTPTDEFVSLLSRKQYKCT